jgi:hypothetical protein
MRLAKATAPQGRADQIAQLALAARLQQASVCEEGTHRANKMKETKDVVDVSDILEADRSVQGLERLDHIKYTVLKRGAIAIVPVEGAGK